MKNCRDDNSIVLDRVNHDEGVPPLTRAHDRPIDLIVDSTGLKILGRGEWNAHKHKTSQKRREWQKESGYRQQARVENSFRGLLLSLRDLLAPMPGWRQNATTQAEVRVFILDRLYDSLPRPPFTEAETDDIALRVYDYVWERSANGHDLSAA